MVKKIMSFSKFLKCEASKSEKIKSLITYAAFAGTKNIVVGDNVFKITKIKKEITLEAESRKHKKQYIKISS